MAESSQDIIEALHNAAEALRKQASELRSREPEVRFGGYSVDIAALKELIHAGK